jgi:DNA-binding SARP family transcriptional activator/DNA-binding beta-propeller fold protein YncE
MEFRILGPLEVVGEQGPVMLHRGKEQALLIFLLLHPNELLPSERLIDELWDGRPPPTAPKILQNAVSRLRKALGDGRVETRPPGYVFHLQPEELDLHRFERLADEGRYDEALALWRGTPLLDLREERFAGDARRRLDEKRLAVLEDRIDGALSAGRHNQLVPELEQLVAEHPLRERLHGQLMRALYGAGRQGDALEAYRRARRTLSEELGLEPGPQLQGLERKILQHDPELAPAAPTRERSRPAASRRRRLALPAAVVALIVAAAVVAILRATGGDSPSILATANSLAVVDPGSERVVGVVPIGSTPRGVAVGARDVWAANAADGTVSEIDPKTLHIVRTIGVGAAATALVETQGEVWVATGSNDTVVRMDAHSGGVLETLTLSREPDATAYTIAAGEHSIWAGSGADVIRIDPLTHTIVSRWRYHGHGGINDIAVARGSVWLATSAETVIRLSASSPRSTDETSIGTIPAAVAIGGGSVWLAATAPAAWHAAVWRMDPATVRVTQTTSFGKRLAAGPPTLDIAFGLGAIWVAYYDDGTVVRIDPRTGNLVSTIKIGGHPSGIAVGAGRVWVTVS